MNERRSAARVAPSEPIPVKLKSSLPARVLDISASGIQVEVATSLRPEADCELRVQLSDGDLVVRARVKRCRAWGFGLDESDRRVLLYRAGLQFGDLPDEAVAKLGRFFAAPAEAVPALEPQVTAPDIAAAPRPTASTAGLPAAPPRSGPVKIRINSEHIRRILQSDDRES